MNWRAAEYYDPNQGNSALAIHVGRTVFLERVGVIAPDVLKTLHRDVFPLFLAWIATAADEDLLGLSASLDMLAMHPADFLASRTSQANSLVESLDHWGKRWHLTDPWIREAAVLTMNEWLEQLAVRTDLLLRREVDLSTGVWLRDAAVLIREAVQRPAKELPQEMLHFQAREWPEEWPKWPASSSCPPFFPTKENFGDFQERVRAWVEWNRKAAAETALKHGLVPTKVNRTRTGNPYQAYDWLVHYKVLRTSSGTSVPKRRQKVPGYGDLTGKEMNNGKTVEQSVVRKAVTALARLIGVRLRRE